MKKKHRQAIDVYVRYLANELGLRDWTIRIDVVDDPGAGLDIDPREEASAVITPATGRKFAAIKIPHHMPDLRREDIRHTLVHELVHCHLEPLWDHITSEYIGGILGAPANQVFMGAANQHLEVAVDGLADVLAPRMPLIDWSLTRWADL